ncbi:TonB-dependent siderophore receptor [Lampropedia puyangensis]|uniref:TonB-dependent siderophore receptor n=1 Tax=Lampropedia puyangensis TaxID=1330072 RepID=A0A4V4GSG0_9BURK|nr:TonB-dependent siderophore receptor [Lampropedia puyangensis]THU05466.1 TonB-dependent siderophore receptor [Lampropedia puyangensis]
MSSNPSSFARRALPPSVVPTVLALSIQALMASGAYAQSATNSDTPALAEVQVSSTAEVTNASEVTKSYENPAVSASTGLTLTRRETPQSVSTVTRQQMDDENVETLDDALLHATGITATQLDIGARVDYRARGYKITNFKVDGGRIDGDTGFAGQGMSINMDLYDRVEILRGANGLMGNTGDPSGAVEMVRKEPRKTRSTTLSATVGSWNKRQLMADVNQPLTSDGRVRSRFVVSGEDSDGFRDREENKAVGALASFAIDATPDTKIGFGAQYERRRLNGATWGTNVPIWFADGTPTSFSRSLNSAADWSFSERESRGIFANVEHRFENNWTTRFQASSAKGESKTHIGASKANSGGNRGYWNQDGTGGAMNTMFQEGENTTKNVQWSLNGPYELWGQRHEFMVGFNGTDSKSTTFGLKCTTAEGVALGACMNRITDQFAIPDWRDFVANGDTFGEITAARTGINTTSRQKTYGGYIANRFRITEPWSVIAGARVSWQRNYSNGNLASEFSKEITPYIGTVYDLNDNYSVYASYTDIFEAQNRRKINGDYIDPKTGSAYEAGIKGEWLDGLFDGSLAVFYTKQQKLATKDLDPQGNDQYVYGNEAEGVAYINGASGVRTKGFEVDFSGRITPNWNMYGGYTYLKVNNPNSPNTDDDPRHLLRLNTSYRLPGALNRLTVGGGLTSQSSMRQSATGTSHPTQGSNVNIDLKGYTLFHAMARYDFSKQLVGTLNISNLFDKTYYRQYGFYAGAIYGEPRAVKLNLRYQF